MAVSAPTSPRSTRVRESGITMKRMIPIGIVVLAFLYPLIDKRLGIGQIGSMEGILIFAILAMGLNIVVGYAGLLDLGYAAFFAIGAYANAFLTSPASYFVRKDWVPDFMR